MPNENASAVLGPSEPEPMPANIRCIQPGRGRCMEWELKWGRFRRWLLRTFFPRYVADMRSRLRGEPAAFPIDVVDSRDLKYFRNVAGCWFDRQDDLFAWRKGIPLALWGAAEMIVFAAPAFLAAWLIYSNLSAPWDWLALMPAAFGGFVVAFFRDPHRLPPADPNAVVSPADGRIVAVEETSHVDFGVEPVVRISIFLSVFDVHVNRVPWAGRVLKLRYHQGKFLDARNPNSALENENLEIGFAESVAPYRRFVVRQIAGAVARRIVCELRPGQDVQRGERFGMIKFGSRTELLLPKAGMLVDARVGATVRGGVTVLARFLADHAV